MADILFRSQKQFVSNCVYSLEVTEAYIRGIDFGVGHLRGKNGRVSIHMLDKIPDSFPVAC